MIPSFICFLLLFSSSIVLIYSFVLQKPINEKYEWESPMDALRQALTMEKDITRFIKQIINYCTDAEDDHLVDYFITDFMDEQLRGQRALAGHINSLRGLLNKDPAMGNWIFDNKLNA